MDKRPFSSLRYPVFMSYAHDDDLAWNYFVTHFNTELNRGLASRLRDLDLPRTHFSVENGPISGPLDAALQQAIKSSFAMMLFVHDNYVHSKWCLQELTYFKELLGEEGFRDRLYIVAMSERAIKRLERLPVWSALFPSPNHVWVPFFGEEHSDWPLEVYSSNSRGKQAVVTSDFWQPFLRLREDLIGKIRDRADTEGETIGVAASSPSPPANVLEALIYIESEPGQERYWEPLGQQVAAAWDHVVAREPREPQLLLRPTGLPMHDLHNRPRLDDADGVILLWGEKATESLLAQISQVEPKLSGPRPAPGLVAYLMEVGRPLAQPVPAIINHWPVVRFATRHGESASATVVDDDLLKLTGYLHEVLRRKRSLR